MMKKIILIFLLLLTACSSGPKTIIEEPIEQTPEVEEVEVVEETMVVDFLGYGANYHVKRDKYLFETGFEYINEYYLNGDEAYLIIPVDGQKLLIEEIVYDDNFNESYEEFIVIDDGEPFILICNESDIRPNARITVNDSYSFVLQVSLMDGKLEQPKNTVPYPWKENDIDESIEVINTIVQSTFDVLNSPYSLNMEEAVELITLVSMYLDPAIVGGEIEVIDYVTYKIPIEVIEEWTIILFNDYTGELPYEFNSDIYETDYITLTRLNNYELLAVEKDGEFVDLLYSQKDIETGYEDTFKVILIKSDTSMIGYRIFDVIKSVG